MGQCIICGTDVDGKICASHEEDVVFTFEGSSPEQLTPGRFYRGTVDGYADFGVFIDLGDRVTGLLHRSKLDRRLESLDWDVGEEVFVQVTNVRDNGDVDLSWSIRQAESEFRGVLVDDPAAGDREPAPEPDAASGSGDATQPAPDPNDVETPGDEPADTGSDQPPAEAPESGEPSTEAPAVDTAPDEAPAQPAAQQVPIGALAEQVGNTVRIEGEVVAIRQTSGPTVFEVRDETAAVDCAAFVEAGVRAYPAVETGGIVRIEGEVRTRRDELQVETDALAILDGEERETVERRLAEAMTARAEPDEFELLAADPALELDQLEGVATAIRRAVLESRPVVVRHPATADGYLAGAAIERATLPLVDDVHPGSDASYHYFDRRPLDGGVYDMDDATNDLTSMLDDRNRHGEPFPLFVFAGAGGTSDSLDGLRLLDVYGARRVIIAGDEVHAEVRATADAAATADQPRTAATVAANAAVGVNRDVRADVSHLPAVSYWSDTPDPYADLAREAGYDEVAIRRLREAVALEAYYQTYEDKRQLIVDLLFDEHDEGSGLADQVSEQFRTKLSTEVETAEPNLEHRQVNGTDVTVLDTDAYTHRFDFPPTQLLLDELHRRHGEAVTVGVDEDEIHVRGADIRSVADEVRAALPTAGITVRGDRMAFLVGARAEIVDAVVEAVATES